MRATLQIHNKSIALAPPSQTNPHIQPSIYRYLVFGLLAGTDRLQRFKIGLTFPENKDQYMGEDQLDLNEGWPDRRGQSNNPQVMGVGRS